MSSDFVKRCGIWLVAAGILQTALPGCAAPLRRPISPAEERNLRAAAVQVLREAASSQEPVLRMHAIEAFQEVAPHEGLADIAANIDNGYSGVSFAALMALGVLRNAAFVDEIRSRAEDPDTNVVIAALFALHRLGDTRRTGDLARYLLDNPDARIRANAALAIGSMGESKSIKLLRTALQREKKIAPKLQILEALAKYGNRHAIERLMGYAYDPRPDLAALALMCLANAKCDQAESLFLSKLSAADFPEIKLQAARGLGRIGRDDGLDLAIAHLRFNSPERGRKDDPPEQQITRIRALAAMALEAIGSPQALGPLKDALDAEDQQPDVRLAAARAVIRIIDSQHGTPVSRPDQPIARKASRLDQAPRKPSPAASQPGRP